jgi:hypothetical protein
MQDTMNVLNRLSQEHDEVLGRINFDSDGGQPSLVDQINPVVVRLNEGKHMAEVACHGPFLLL